MVLSFFFEVALYLLVTVNIFMGSQVAQVVSITLFDMLYLTFALTRVP